MWEMSSPRWSAGFGYRKVGARLPVPNAGCVWDAAIGSDWRQMSCQAPASFGASEMDRI
ncbi:hypothetical protein K491DRAFT_691596 [Lophiostoma macrostomum CBS 122681]|uniref:Uncharacterized protein n=1 Tax=Lophiostoma macrostomum CBS 122681 TaxID=1314788 RepID=A0A6A6TC66_9PLEO|nr:hypothetical protein K491DRAFT_691596 [Lophiostoma macrostomum CBS 122681]